ncbi:MAG: response regulator transcription factor [Lachnospiraceae bacterium]
MRLLLAEDERELSNATAAVLRHHKYSVDTVYNGTDALDWALSENYDALILDIMMPGLTGLEVLEQLRSKGYHLPVLLLTAKTQIEDRIAGLDLGADDYLPKPFAMGELLARIRAMTRRKTEYEPNTVLFAELSLDRENFVLAYKEGSFRLNNKEFQIMEMLMTNPHRLISTEQFMERIWGLDAEAEINVVWVYISYLRKKIASLQAPVQIKAARGQGYMLEETDD